MEQRRKAKLMKLMGAVLALVVMMVPFAPALAQAEQQQTLVLFDDGLAASGVKIWGVDVSGMNRAQMLAYFTTGEGAALVQQAKVTLALPMSTKELDLKELGATAKVEEAIDNALMVGRDGGIQTRIGQIDTAKSQGIALGIPYQYDDTKLQTMLSSLSQSIPRTSVAGEFKFDPALPARFTITDGHKGFTPDEPALVAAVRDALNKGTLDNVIVPGQVATDNVQTLKEGTKENTTLVGKFTTKVDGNSNRVSNVKQGAKMINGKILQPGEIFSCNDTLGPRDGSSGYWKKAGALLNGQSVVEYGGGICQVSTTLFNAVARADLEMVEWVHHSIPSSYVTIGCDATISTGGPDFRFKNNTEWPIYIVANYEDATRKLTFEIWGRPLPEGRYIEITGKRTGGIGQPADVIVKDPDKVAKGRSGTKSETWKIWYNKDGTEYSREMIHNNTYPARPSYVLAPVVTPPPATP